MEVKNIIFYKTTADFDNTGEVLIYKTLLEYIRLYGNVILDDSPRTQPLFLKRIGMHDDERLSKHTRFSFIAYMIIMSISNFFSRENHVYFVTGVGEHKVSGWKDVIKNLCAFFLFGGLSLLGVKSLRIGMSISFSGPKEEWSERMVSRVITRYYVRDRISQHNCIVAGVKKCRFAPDLSWAYRVDFSDSQTRDTIILSLRSTIGSKQDSSYKEELKSAFVYLTEFLHTSYPEYRLILTHQVNKDLPFITELYELAKGKDIPIELCNELITLDNASKFYGKASIVFSNRLHVLLLAYKFGALSAAFTDTERHIKIRGIFNDNGMSDCLIPISLDRDSLQKRVNKLLEDREVYLSKLRQAEKDNRQELSEIFKVTFEG